MASGRDQSDDFDPVFRSPRDPFWDGVARPAPSYATDKAAKDWALFEQARKAARALAESKLKTTSWVYAEGKHAKAINTERLDTLYIHYRRYGEWAVIGTIGSADISIATYATEEEAKAALAKLLHDMP